MNKWMAMILAAAMAAAMAACGGSGGNVAEEDGTPAQIAQGAGDSEAPQDSGSGMEEAGGREAPSYAKGATLTIGGVTYQRGDKVGKLFDSGWYIQDDYFPDFRGPDMRVEDFGNYYHQFDLSHDSVNAHMLVTCDIKQAEPGDAVGELPIDTIRVWFSDGETPWDISGMASNTDTLESVLQALPDAIDTEEEGVHVRISFNSYFNIRDDGTAAGMLWNLADEYFYFIEVYL